MESSPEAAASNGAAAPSAEAAKGKTKGAKASEKQSTAKAKEAKASEEQSMVKLVLQSSQLVRMLISTVWTVLLDPMDLECVAAGREAAKEYDRKQKAAGEDSR